MLAEHSNVAAKLACSGWMQLCAHLQTCTTFHKCCLRSSPEVILFKSPSLKTQLTLPKRVNKIQIKCRNQTYSDANVSARSLRLIDSQCEPLHLSPRWFSLRLRWPHHLLPQSPVVEQQQQQQHISLSPPAPSFMSVRAAQRRRGYFTDALQLMWQIQHNCLKHRLKQWEPLEW